MKKFLSLFVVLGMIFSFSPILSAAEASVILVEDWTGITEKVDVTDVLFGASNAGAESYSFSKSCNDWQGCPAVIRGTMNGDGLAVYRQYYNGSGSSVTAWYSGWIYS